MKKYQEVLDSVGIQVVSDLRLECLELVKQGAELIDLSMINPDLPPAQLLLDRLIEASVKPSAHRYTASKGLRRLREAFSEKYHNAFDRTLDPQSEICVTEGSKDGVIELLSVFSSSISEKKEKMKLFLPSPTYPAYYSAARLTGGFELEIYQVSSNEQETVGGILSLLEKNKRGIILVNFPHNPSGVVLSEESVQQITRAAQDSEFILISDFVYGEMGSSAPYTSFLPKGGSKKGVVELYSLSKAYSVPGWRVAALVGDSEIVTIVARRKSHTGYGLFGPIQLAAAAALRAPSSIVQATSLAYLSRCGVIVEELRSLGFSVDAPSSGASVWAKIPEDTHIASGVDAARWFMKECGIVALPGEAFGERYKNYLRFAAVKPEEILRECFLVARERYSTKEIESGKENNEASSATITV